MGDEIPGPFDRLRDRLNQANGQRGKYQTHLWKHDLALTTCPQCGIEIKYTSSEKWRGARAQRFDLDSNADEVQAMTDDKAEYYAEENPFGPWSRALRAIRKKALKKKT